MNLNGHETDGVPAPSEFELGTWVSDDDGPPYAELMRLYEAARTLILDWQTRNDALTAERDGYRAVAEQRAQEVERLATENEMLWEANRKMQRTVDRVEKTTTQSRDALISERDSARAEVERLREENTKYLAQLIEQDNERQQMATDRADCYECRGRRFR